jgi:hypothetical protein
MTSRKFPENGMFKQSARQRLLFSHCLKSKGIRNRPQIRPHEGEFDVHCFDTVTFSELLKHIDVCVNYGLCALKSPENHGCHLAHLSLIAA